MPITRHLFVSGLIPRVIAQPASSPPPPPPPPPPSSWVVGDHNYTQGNPQPFNVAATGPVALGYAAGGTYGISPTNTALPSGVTMTAAGAESYDGSGAAATATGIYYTYHEPGALPILTLFNGTVTGSLPYFGTIYPAEGAVPSGQILLSADDSNFRSSVLSTWEDGSAQVMVFAGETTFASANTSKTITVKPGLASGTDLTPAFIASKLSSITTNFGTSRVFSNFAGGYERIWWQNPQYICARYRHDLAKGTMQAIIDVHAFASGRVFVEFVIENGLVDASTATVVGPSAQTYTNATVAITPSGGSSTTIRTVSSPTVGMAVPNARLSGNYSGTHEPFRAWYCAGWVNGTTASATGGSADPLVEVTHDAASLQAHPWFYRPAETSTQNMATKYSAAYDTYVPWATCRLRMPGMDGGGDDEQIALFTEEQADYIVTGSRYARAATLATGLACHSADFNWRHNAGEVPTVAQLDGKGTTPLGTWPRINTEPQWGGPNTTDGSHIPSVSLVPFLCRPSPCFIEIAQKELCWNFTNYVGGINVGLSGRHRYDQIRSRAWRVRNYATTAFLTPDADTSRKTAYRTLLASNAQDITEFLNIPGNTLGALWDSAVSDLTDASSSRPTFQTSFWMMNFVVFTYIHIAAAKVLRGSEATTWNAMVDSYCRLPAKFINDAVSYEWRAIPYQPTIGTASGSTIIFASDNWQTIAKNELSGSEWQSPGKWLDFQPDDFAWSTCTAWDNASVGGNYSAIFWFALCAAVERDVTGASTAWDKVVTNGGITNLSAWRTGFRTMPRFNRWPRNK